VQVDPTKPKLKALKAERLKPNYDETLSIFAYKFNLRRFTKVTSANTKLASADAPEARMVITSFARLMAKLPVRPVRYESLRHKTPCTSIFHRLTEGRAKAWCLLVHAEASLPPRYCSPRRNTPCNS